MIKEEPVVEVKKSKVLRESFNKKEMVIT